MQPNSRLGAKDGTAKPKGRKRLHPDVPSGGNDIKVTLPPQDKAKAKRIGDGNVSLGIRRALAAFKERPE